MLDGAARIRRRDIYAIGGRNEEEKNAHDLHFY